MSETFLCDSVNPSPWQNFITFQYAASNIYKLILQVVAKHIIKKSNSYVIIKKLTVKIKKHLKTKL